MPPAKPTRTRRTSHAGGRFVTAPGPGQTVTVHVRPPSVKARRTAAATVAEALDGLPLALEQAAAYIERKSDLSSYAKLVQSRLGELARFHQQAVHAEVGLVHEPRRPNGPTAGKRDP